MTIYRCPVRIDFDGPGAPAYNIWHLRVADQATTDQPQVDAALLALKTFYDSIKGLYAPGGVIRVPHDLVNLSTTPPTSRSFTPVVLGATGTTEAPPLLAMCISWKTTVRTRSGRGRTFIGPLANSTIDSSDGTPGSTVRTTLGNAAQALINSSGGSNGWAIGVYSRTENLIRDVVAYSHTDQFAVMRSRR